MSKCTIILITFKFIYPHTHMEILSKYYDNSTQSLYYFFFCNFNELMLLLNSVSQNIEIQIIRKKDHPHNT